MERTELEKLMDRYKREMMEFSRKNGGLSVSDAANSGMTSMDARERAMEEAVEENKPFEIDRSNPLPEIVPAESEAVETSEQQQPAAVEAQAPMPAQNVEMSGGAVDIPRMLRESCVRVASNPNSTPEQKQRCRDINDYLAANNESGTLRVETFASDRAFGVGSARVMIFLPLESGNVMVFDGITDINGLSDNVRLPAPPRELSLTPRASGSALPYSVYTVYVEHPNYVRSLFSSVPVFSGIESVQPVRMLAKAAGLSEPEPVVVDETGRSTLQR